MKLIIDDKNGQYRYSGMANPEDIRDAKRLYNQWKTAIPKIEHDLIAEGLLPEDPLKKVLLKGCTPEFFPFKIRNYI